MTHTTHQNRMPRAVNLLAVVALIGAALMPGSLGAAYAQEEPSPFLRAFPDGNAVDGGNWPLGANVHLAIDDPTTTEIAPDYEQDATVIESPWDWLSTYVRFDFDAVYDLKRGDVVTLSADGFERYLIVPDLWVTTVDPETDIVAGTLGGAEPGTLVHVFIGGDAQLYVPTDTEGAWVANFGSIGFDLQPGMGGAAEVWFDEFNDSTIFDWMAPPLAPWRDEFDGSLGEGWYWVNENPSKWNLTEQPGFLRVYASPYMTGGENLLLRPVAQGDFMIKTRVLFEPNTNFQFAGLVIYQDQKNYLQFGRAFCDVPYSCVGNGIYFDKVLDGGFTESNYATMVDNPNEAYLRLERRGDMVKAFFSYEGVTWFEIGTHWIPADFQVNGIGLAASQDYNAPGTDISADFDFFELTEGWGFLPEGYHDYSEGDVPDTACTAGGWAVDPDDRETDIWVEVAVDGVSLPDWAQAGEFRQDLLDSEQCVGGSCGYFVNLWGKITSYQAHNITIYAQDIPSGEWVLLYNTPKSLTCRSYDIYVHDPLTGESRQVTLLEETGEYNPS